MLGTGETDVTAIDIQTAGAAATTNGNVAVIIANTTNAAITPGANTGAGFDATTGLEIIALKEQAGVNYGSIDAGDFIFA